MIWFYSFQFECQTLPQTPLYSLLIPLKKSTIAKSQDYSENDKCRWWKTHEYICGLLESTEVQNYDTMNIEVSKWYRKVIQKQSRPFPNIDSNANEHVLFHIIIKIFGRIHYYYYSECNAFYVDACRADTVLDLFQAKQNHLVGNTWWFQMDLTIRMYWQNSVHIHIRVIVAFILYWIYAILKF